MIVILSSIITVGWGGFVLACLWSWFVVPLGVPTVLWWQGAGLVLATSQLTGYAGAHAAVAAYKAIGIAPEHTKYLGLFLAVVMPTVLLGGGWLIKTFGPIIEAML